MPTAPRRAVGEISERYIGARPAFKPELMPMISLPKNWMEFKKVKKPGDLTYSLNDYSILPISNISQLPAVLAKNMKSPEMAIKILFKSNPPFRPNFEATIPTVEPPIIPPTQNDETIQDQIKVTLSLVKQLASPKSLIISVVPSIVFSQSRLIQFMIRL